MEVLIPNPICHVALEFVAALKNLFKFFFFLKQTTRKKEEKKLRKKITKIMLKKNLESTLSLIYKKVKRQEIEVGKEKKTREKRLRNNPEPNRFLSMEK